MLLLPTGNLMRLRFMPVFDTLKFSNTLKTAGIPAPQADAQAVALAEALETCVGRLATSDGLRQQSTTLRGEMARLGTELRAEMAQQGTELRTEMAQLGTELRSEMAQLGTALRAEMAQMGAELRGEMTQMGAELRGEMGQMGAELRGDMKQMKADLQGQVNQLKWMIGVMGLGIAAVLQRLYFP